MRTAQRPGTFSPSPAITAVFVFGIAVRKAPLAGVWVRGAVGGDVGAWDVGVGSWGLRELVPYVQFPASEF